MGLPVIAYKSCSGANELIVNGVNGILCDAGGEALAEGVKTLMSNAEKRRMFGEEARNSMRQYNAENIWKGRKKNSSQ